MASGLVVSLVLGLRVMEVCPDSGEQAQLAADSSDLLPHSTVPDAAPAVAGAALMLVQLLVLDMVLEDCEVQIP